MGNLYGKFRVSYLNFSGSINIKSDIINHLELVLEEYNVIKIITKTIKIFFIIFIC